LEIGIDAGLHESLAARFTGTSPRYSGNGGTATVEDESAPATLLFLGGRLAATSGILKAGVDAAVASQLVFGRFEAFAGGHGGLLVPIDGMHIELLSEAGIHHLRGVGGWVFRDGEPVTVPYVGARINVSQVLRRQRLPRAGLGIFGRLDTRTRTIVSREAFWCSFGGCEGPNEIYEVGGFTVGLVAGGSFQLL
jgi:hypothetical protein